MSEKNEVTEGKTGVKRKNLFALAVAISLILIVCIILLVVKSEQTQDLKSIMSAIKRVFGGA